MRILVTGSAGLVGTRLVARLRDEGHDILGIDVRANPHASDAAALDIRSARALALVDGSLDGIVHLAAVSRVAWGEADPRLTHAVNVDGTAELIDAARRRAPGAWLLFASSREVYGDMTTDLVREEDPLLPINVYGRSKEAGEVLVRSASEAGLATAIVRLCNVYGGRADHPDRAVPALAQRALDAEPLLLTDGGTYFDFVHVDDVVDGLLLVIGRLAAGDRRVPTVHLATGQATSLRALADLAVDIAASTSPVVEAPARGFDVAGFCGAPDKAAKVLGWRATISLEDGLSRFMADLVANGPLAPFPLAALQNSGQLHWR